MLKTNNKQVRESIKNYLLDSLEYQVEDYDNVQSRLAEVMRWYKDGCARRTERYGRIEYEYGESLGQFLTTTGITETYTEEMRELLKNWLHETDEEAQRFDSTKVWQTFCNLTQRELLKLADTYGVKIIYTEHDNELNNTYIKD